MRFLVHDTYAVTRRALGVQLHDTYEGNAHLT